MAENESLDLANPGGQRWRHVFDAVKKQKSAEEVARQIELKLPQSLRKAFKEFLEKDVTLEELLAKRNNPQALRRLVRQCEGHEYAHLFAHTAAISTGKDGEQLFVSYLNGVLDRVADQITHGVASVEGATIAEVRSLIGEARRAAKPDIARIAKRLAKDPNWNPTVKPRDQRQKAEDFKSLLNVSLLGDKK